MTSREIIKSLIKEKKCPERMGLFEHFWIDTQPEWEKQGLPKNINLDDYFNYDIRFVPGTWFDTASFVIGKLTLEEDEETFIYQNGWGAKMREWKNKMGTPEHIYFDMTTEEIWREKYRDNLLKLDLNRFGNLDEMTRNYDNLMKTDRFIAFNNMFIFEVMRKSMGDVVMLESMYLNPEWIHDFCDVVTNNMILHIEYLFKNIGLPDGMWIYEDLGYTRAPFISPKTYKEIIFPYHKRLIDFIHSYDLPFIMHSCGKIEPYIPYFAEAGVDCLQVLEAKAGQSVIKMSETINNRMAFMGNLDIVAFESNDPKILEAEVVPKLMKIKDKKIPFIFHSDHSIPKSVKLDTYRYALQLYDKYGKY